VRHRSWLFAHDPRFAEYADSILDLYARREAPRSRDHGADGSWLPRTPKTGSVKAGKAAVLALVDGDPSYLSGHSVLSRASSLIEAAKAVTGERR
jgi:hypothetical protein